MGLRNGERKNTFIIIALKLLNGERAEKKENLFDRGTRREIRSERMNGRFARTFGRVTRNAHRRHKVNGL